MSSSPPSNPQDAELALRCAAGDRPAYDALFERWFAHVLPFARSRTRTESEAEAAVGAILGAAFADLPLYDGFMNPLAWVFGYAWRWSQQHGALQAGGLAPEGASRVTPWSRHGARTETSPSVHEPETRQG